MNLNLNLRWTLPVDGQPIVLDPLVFELLQGVREGGHLNYAAKATGVSYRHAWGLLRDWEARFGKALLSSRQGRGAHLTEFAETLLGIVADTEAALTAPLERAALNAAARLSDATDARRHPVTMVSSHSERVLALRDALKERHRVTFDVTGSETALHRYRRGDIDIAGFHLPLGNFGRTVAASLIGLLNPARDQIWLLEQRTLGLISRPQQPSTRIEDLADGTLRFINRQAGSGTRMIFDALLTTASIAPGKIVGYDNEEYTHSAVAALVASASADVAFGTGAAARQFDLHFEAFVDERFYLVMSREADSSLRRAVADFCVLQQAAAPAGMKTDEFAPTVAALKRIHKAGFWKGSSTKK